MNQMTQNRCGGVPVAHNGNTKTRLFRKPFGMMLFLAALVMAGGKAWGDQGETWTSGNTYGGNIYGNIFNNGNYIITIDNSTADVTLDIVATIGAFSSLGTYFNEVHIRPATTTHKCILKNCITDGTPMFKVWGAGSGWNCGTLYIEAGITIDGNGKTNNIIEIAVSGLPHPFQDLGGKCHIEGTSNNPVIIKDNDNTAINNNWELWCNYCEFNNNYTAGGGAAIYNYHNAVLQYSTFYQNESLGNDTNHSGGGAIFNKGGITYTSCTFRENTTSKDGGAIYNYLLTSNTFNDCEFYDNEARSGGAIVEGATAVMQATNCIFNGNLASDNGGAIYTVSQQNSNPCTLTTCSFVGNQAVSGGGIYAQHGISMTNCTFDGNFVVSNGTNNGLGGAFFYAGSDYATTATINGGSMYSNTASSGWGGAIYADKTSNSTNSCSLTLENNPSIYNNTAKLGGGIYVGDGCSLTMSASDIYKNTASNYGGGVYVTSGGTLSMSAGSIGKSDTGNANTANKGGGVYVAGGTFNLSGGNVQYNTTSGSNNYGSGIYLASGSVSMTGGKVNNNTGAAQGGGVYVAGGTFGLSSGEIISNSAGPGGGVYQAGGNFNQSGGYIGKSGYGNTSTGFGAGVYLNAGIFAMSGGQIVNNSTNSYGGGVYKNAGTLRVTGAPVIKDNSLYDVFLNNATDRYVLIGSDGLQCGAEIGVFKTTGGYDIVHAEGSNAAANANYAMRNGFFFDDQASNAVRSSRTSPFYDPSSSQLYFVANSTITSATWSQTTAPAGYVVSGNTITISTATGLAYFANQVNTGSDDYSGKTINLTDDLSLSGKQWVPIGDIGTECSSANRGFNGTFDGQGHTIKDITVSYPYKSAGLFGYVNGGTIKNLMVVSSTVGNATISNGGIVGELNGGSVYNCMANITPSGGTNNGALVGRIANSGAVKNCYAISDAAAAGNGTVTNCYVRKASGGTAANMGTATNVGSSTTGTFTAVETTRPYSYNCFDNQVGSTPLLTLLNQWVDSQNNTPADLAHWTRATTSLINDDYPILMMPGHDAVASDGGVLHYGAVLGTGNLLSTYTTNAYAICLYNSVSSVASNSSSNAEFYINEDVAIGSGSGVNAHVGITLKDATWHMFSPAIAAAPLGITYTDNTTDYGYNDPLPEVSFNTSDGYFPQTNISGGGYYDSWDYYCYYEPEYHWINFKRNSNSHHHEDGNHEHINYTNETTLIPAKGYLLGTKLQTFLQSEGTLNDGNVSIALTSQSPLRTGYNFIGNPYQAYLDFNEFAKNSNNLNIWQGGTLSNASYVILEGAGNSAGYMSYVYGASDNPFGADRYLHPHQGFMVVVKNGASRAYFTNGMRKTTGSAFRDEQINYPLVNLIVTEEDGRRDIATVELGRPEVGGAIKQYDLHYGKGCIYTHYEDQDYAIAFTLPGINEVSVRFETDEDATYTLSWDTENGEFSYLHLIDNITGIDTDCLATSEYRFTAKTSDYKSRFKLVFGYTGVEENEDGASTGSATFAFLMGNELVVNCGPSTGSGTATLQMFDLMGRMMMERHVIGTQTSIMMPDMPAGVYVLRLSGNNGTRTQKIVME